MPKNAPFPLVSKNIHQRNVLKNEFHEFFALFFCYIFLLRREFFFEYENIKDNRNCKCNK